LAVPGRQVQTPWKDKQSFGKQALELSPAIAEAYYRRFVSTKASSHQHFAPLDKQGAARRSHRRVTPWVVHSPI